MSKYNDAPRIHQEFYYYLGLLSTKFAILENNVMSLLGKLIVDEVFLINTIIEGNSLSQNLKLLTKLNRYRSFEPALVGELIRRIDKLRIERNLFIHAVWGEPIEKDNTVYIGCIEYKITPKPTPYGLAWLGGQEHEFKLDHLQDRIKELDELISIQEELIEKVERPAW